MWYCHKGIPYKGQVLNQIAAKFLDATADMSPNWKIAAPVPDGYNRLLCKPFPLEMIIRGYLTGSSWRTYKNGARQICGVPIPDWHGCSTTFPRTNCYTYNKSSRRARRGYFKRKQDHPAGNCYCRDYEMLEKYTKAIVPQRYRNGGREIIDPCGY